ncbi:hypothetical protein [Flavobacterium seoulense]|uniref:Uncharacterized protein n=1 Tax=Flavobacterium seoulense TaxID=1492738 RepID=A0A066WV79_9FLAO|nr:hypothetical protein [Flavobacterium seoulense]KDN54585.1 hypothetical protein FEM21_23080 [Flavobacterium seoulense]
MRILSKLEQEICKRILKNSGSNNFIANIIDNDLKGVCIEVKRNPKKAGLIFTINSDLPTSEEKKYIIDKTEELSVFILQVVNLLKMLEKDGYILLLERGSNSKEDNKFGRCVINLPSVEYSFKDDNIISLLCEYTNKEIYSTDEFKRFCENGFVPRDEQRFKKQIKITQTALFVAISALLFNVGYNLFKTTPDSIKINQDQHQNLSMGFYEIKNRLDSIIKNSNIETNTKVLETMSSKLDSINTQLKKINTPLPHESFRVVHRKR